LIKLNREFEKGVQPVVPPQTVSYALISSHEPYIRKIFIRTDLKPQAIS